MFASLTLISHIVVSVIITVKVIFRRLPVGTSLAWVLIVASFPFFGAIIYMLIGDHRLGRKRMRLGHMVRKYYQKELSVKSGAVEDHPEVQNTFMKIGEVAAQGTGFHIRSDNRVALLSTPEEIFTSLIADIHKSRQTCFLEFYIIEAQGRVNEVLEAIMSAAKRGVDCRIIADHIGSRKFFKSEWISKFETAGVKVVDSLPTGIVKTFFVRSDLRNHRKIIVIDRDICYTGSFNLADPKYFNRKKAVGPWVDLFVRMEGDVAEALSVVFNTDYVLDTHDRKSLRRIPSLPDLETELAPDVLKMNTALHGTHGKNKPLQIIPSGPEMATSVIYETIISSVYTAQDYIMITTPYLIPDEPLLLALTNAARRGVEVSIIVPQKVDSMMVRFASKSYYGELLDAGVRIFEFQEGLLHTKTILIDDSVCYLGTVNLDMRSFYLNLEITLALHAAEDCTDVRNIVSDYISSSKEVDAELWGDGRRSKPAMFAENLVRLASPLL